MCCTHISKHVFSSYRSRRLVHTSIAINRENNTQETASLISGDQQQTELFDATLDATQEVTDKNVPMGPIQLCDDLNAQLPRGYKLSKSRHTHKSYSTHSLIMYDLISTYNLICVDFKYPQTVNCTYFQHETKAYTWIDHVLVSASMSDNRIVNCFIRE